MTKKVNNHDSSTVNLFEKISKYISNNYKHITFFCKIIVFFGILIIENKHTLKC